MADDTNLEIALEQPQPKGTTEGEGEMPITPDPYELTEENRKKISSRMDKRLGVDKFSRTQFERAWFRNVCFHTGQQDLIVDRGRFRLRETPPWYPKVQTNKFKE